jgi:hypothetical protein
VMYISVAGGREGGVSHWCFAAGVWARCREGSSHCALACSGWLYAEALVIGALLREWSQRMQGAIHCVVAHVVARCSSQWLVLWLRGSCIHGGETQGASQCALIVPFMTVAVAAGSLVYGKSVWGCQCQWCSAQGSAEFRAQLRFKSIIGSLVSCSRQIRQSLGLNLLG